MHEGNERETVLLVEDVTLIRMDGHDELEDAGYRVIEAADADQALGIIQADPDAVDVLVTDIHMPGSMDGCTLSREVHRLWPHIRLVITSSHDRLTDADMPDHGRFVRRPASSGALLSAIHRAGKPD